MPSFYNTTLKLVRNELLGHSVTDVTFSERPHKPGRSIPPDPMGTITVSCGDLKLEIDVADYPEAIRFTKPLPNMQYVNPNR